MSGKHERRDSERFFALIRELHEDPLAFDKRGRAYDLLVEYRGSGEELEALRELLRSKSEWAVRAGIFVASEIGRDACPLLDDVLPLLEGQELAITCEAMECVAVCAKDSRAGDCAQLALKLESNDERLRTLAMFLMSNVSEENLSAAGQALEGCGGREEHVRGLVAVADGGASDEDSIRRMTRSTSELMRRYGAIAAVRTYETMPEVVRDLIETGDSDIVNFITQKHLKGLWNEV